MKKFTIIDYIIIILVICAVVFAFIHITTDDSASIQKTAFDASTMNKLPETYLNYYKDGNIVKATVTGFNSTTGEDVSLDGTVKWVGEDNGQYVKLLIDTINGSYLCGLYKHVPNADIYIDTVSLESDGSKYDNLVEITAKPEKITSLNDLNNNLSDCDCEISTVISLDSVDSVKLQEINNKIYSNNKRLSIGENPNLNNQIIINKATPDNINDASSILGNINGETGQITIRIYNCSESQLDSIKDAFEVTNIRKF